MKVRDLMGHPVRGVGPTASLAEAATVMSERDVGFLPVVDQGRLVGTITDRDIAVRAAVRHMPTRRSVERIMSVHPVVCTPEEEVDDVIDRMAEQQLRRLPVCTGDGKLIGIFSLADAARTEEYQEAAARALANISRPHGRHCQRRDSACRT